MDVGQSVAAKRGRLRPRIQAWRIAHFQISLAGGRQFGLRHLPGVSLELEAVDLVSASAMAASGSGQAKPISRVGK